MAGTTSVSKGVFSFKAAKSKKRKDAAGLSTTRYWGKGLEEGEEEVGTELTYSNYNRCWKAASDILKELQDNIHGKVFQDLINFVHAAARKVSTHGTPDKRFDLREVLGNIPTACLVTGVNMPDRDSTFASLVRLLKTSVTPHVAQLKSKECTTVRMTVYKMISQLIGQSSMMDPDLEEEEVGPAIKRNQCTMSVLTSWYKEFGSSRLEDYSQAYQNSPQKFFGSPSKSSKGMVPDSPSKATRSASKRMLPDSPSKFSRSPCKRIIPDSPSKFTRSPRKRITPNSPSKLKSPSKRMMPSSPSKRTAPSTPGKTVTCSLEDEESPRKRVKSGLTSVPEKGSKAPLVVILEDVESFLPSVLNDLLLICSEHRRDLPMVMVFGVATSPDTVQQSLSHDAAACLAMELFQAEPSTHYLTKIIEKVLMSDKVPFHLGGKPFKLLLDIFLYSDFSVASFIKGLKVCMIEHFLSQPSSILCCPVSRRPALVRSMTQADLDTIRKLPSFRAYVESVPPKEQAALLLDEKLSKATILNQLEKLDAWYQRFCCLVKVVHTLTYTLSGAPLGRQVREVLATCLSQPLVETEEFQEATKGIRNMAREELLSTLRNICEVLQEHMGQDEELSELLNEASMLVGRLSSLDQLDEAMVEESTQPGEAVVTIEATDRFHLKEKLLEMAKNKPKKTNVYDLLRSEVVQFLTDTFRKHLQPPTSQPLHEVSFFHSSSSVKRLLVGLPRPALATALVNPHHYLQCECCHLEDPSNLLTTLPDISVAYKLHLECGRLINLYDWLQAFVSVVGTEDGDAPSKKIDDHLQARFVLAVSELQFLGFVKPTRRKTDHVERLTWGGC